LREAQKIRAQRSRSNQVLKSINGMVEIPDFKQSEHLKQAVKNCSNKMIKYYKSNKFGEIGRSKKNLKKNENYKVKLKF